MTRKADVSGRGLAHRLQDIGRAHQAAHTPVVEPWPTDVPSEPDGGSEGPEGGPGANSGEGGPGPADARV